VRCPILGPTEARTTVGAAVPLGGGRVRELLTVLPLPAPRAAPDATLIDEIRAVGDAPRGTHRALRALVSRPRRALGTKEAVAVGPNGGYRLVVDTTADTTATASSGSSARGEQRWQSATRRLPPPPSPRRSRCGGAASARSICPTGVRRRPLEGAAPDGPCNGRPTPPENRRHRRPDFVFDGKWAVQGGQS
jgi:hypothetical protein